MSLAQAAATLLQEAGVSADDILAEAGVDRQGAVRELASRLGVDLKDLVQPTDLFGDAAQPVEVSDDDVATVREAIEILGRTFN